jgi:hypothetical protein
MLRVTVSGQKDAVVALAKVVLELPYAVIAMMAGESLDRLGLGSHSRYVCITKGGKIHADMAYSNGLCAPDGVAWDRNPPQTHIRLAAEFYNNVMVVLPPATPGVVWKQADDEDLICMVCTEKVSGIVSICGHASACADCHMASLDATKEAMNCLICREKCEKLCPLAPLDFPLSNK